MPVITASPAATPTTLPDAFTVAMVVSEESHLTEEVPVIVLSTVAVSVSLAPTAMLVLDLFRAIADGLLYADLLAHS